MSTLWNLPPGCTPQAVNLAHGGPEPDEHWCATCQALLDYDPRHDEYSCPECREQERLTELLTTDDEPTPVVPHPCEVREWLALTYSNGRDRAEVDFQPSAEAGTWAAFRVTCPPGDGTVDTHLISYSRAIEKMRRAKDADL